MALTRLGLNQAINLASNVTGTLATGNGGTGATSFTAGKVLQVVTGTITNDNFVTSSTPATLLTVNITPSATTSKVFVTCAVQYNNYGNGSSSFPNGKCQILDQDDNVLVRGYGNFSGNVSTDQTDQFDSTIVLNNLDSPSSTSQQSYKLQYYAGAGRFGILGASNRLNGTIMTLMEIAA
jgi:hypothetical protein